MLTFNRPDVLNAFDTELYLAVAGALDTARDDDGVRVVVLSGAGRAFSAGADRSLIDGTASADARRQAAEEFPAVLAALDACDIPVVVAVNGLAVGFGATVLLHCDLVLVAASARLRFPFTALGIVPEAGSSALLPARAPWGDAAWALLSSEWIDAEAALRLGVAWRVVADERLKSEAQTVAATLAALDRASVTATKRLLVAGREDVIASAMARELDAMAMLPAARRPDRPLGEEV